MEGPAHTWDASKREGNRREKRHKATAPEAIHSPDNPCTVSGQSQEHELALQPSRFRLADSKIGRIWPLVALYPPPF